MRKTNLLWIDCLAALLAGVAVLALYKWLAPIYRLPENLLLAIGVVNVIYGVYSLSLAAAPHRRTRFRIAALACANMGWAPVCFALGVAWLETASPFGLAQLFGEGLFVGTLGFLEWRARAALVAEA
jgi:hypothetical protein